VRERLTAEGFELETMSPAELTRFVADEIAKWGPLAKRFTTDAVK
jgi:tripartite-type tricarboxylate transporter receptor subunit TctC